AGNGAQVAAEWGAEGTAAAAALPVLPSKAAAPPPSAALNASRLPSFIAPPSSRPATEHAPKREFGSLLCPEQPPLRPRRAGAGADAAIFDQPRLVRRQHLPDSARAGIAHRRPALAPDVGVHPAAQERRLPGQLHIAPGPPRPAEPGGAVRHPRLAQQPAAREDEAELLCGRRARRGDIALLHGARHAAGDDLAAVEEGGAAADDEIDHSGDVAAAEQRPRLDVEAVLPALDPAAV